MIPWLDQPVLPSLRCLARRRMTVQVGMRKYARLSPSTFGLVGKKVIAVIRTSGAISGAGGGNPLQSAGITANEVCLLTAVSIPGSLCRCG